METGDRKQETGDGNRNPRLVARNLFPAVFLSPNMSARKGDIFALCQYCTPTGNILVGIMIDLFTP